MTMALVGPIPQWVAPKDAISPPLTRTSYGLAVLQICDYWGRNKPEELQWLVKSIANERISEDIPVLTIPPTKPATPRIGEFGKRGCDCCATRVYRVDEDGKRVATTKKTYVRLATGSFKCVFSNRTEVLDLCSACAFRDAYIKWSGNFSPKLLRCDLVATYDREKNGTRLHFQLSPNVYEMVLKKITTYLGVSDEDRVERTQHAG